MKAVIRLDVPNWQIGQAVHVFFKDTMEKNGVCESEEPVKPKVEKALLDFESWHYVCGECKKPIDIQDNFCRHCGKPVEHA